MGQCGCGDIDIEKGYEFPDRTVVAYDIYRGCRECNPGPAISIFAYPNRKAGRMWLDNAQIEKYVPDENGGNHGRGISFGLFEVEDLMAEAQEIVEKRSAEIGPGEDQYATINDWLHDFGLELIQGAMWRYRQRIQKKNK
jgi:hypothetical protein